VKLNELNAKLTTHVFTSHSHVKSHDSFTHVRHHAKRHKNHGYTPPHTHTHTHTL